MYGKAETVTPTEDGDQLLTTVMVGDGLKIATVEEVSQSELLLTSLYVDGSNFLSVANRRARRSGGFY